MPVTMRPQPDTNGELEASHIGDMKALYELIKNIPLTTAGNRTETLLGEITNLRTQVKSKDEEVDRLTAESNKIQTDRDASLELLLNANGRAKQDCAAAEQHADDLNTRIHELEASLAEERKSKNTLEKRYTELDSACTQEKKKVAQTQDECKKKDKLLKDKDSMIEKMRTAGKELKQKFNDIEKHNKTLETTLEDLKSTMAKKDGELAKLESFRTPYQQMKEEDILAKYDGIWDLAVTEISKHLQVGIPLGNMTSNRIRKGLLIHTPTYNIPLPCSNTKPAKQMRLISILALLAREIDKQIFQPAFFISGESGIRESLLKLVMTDGEKEAYCRSILLSIDAGNAANDLDERIKNVIKNVSSCVDDIFTDEESTKISASVKIVAQRAAEVWKIFQRMKKKYEPDFETLQSGSEDCEPFDFPNDESGSGEESTNISNTPPFIVFPRLCQYEEDISYTRCKAIVVRKSMPQFMAAEKEQMATEPQSPVRRVAATRERRPSLDKRRGKGHASQNGSFLDR